MTDISNCIFNREKVKYLCTCGSQRPITRIYYCRHCSELRCGDCVSHEVDSHYCPNCLEYMPSPEARLKKNRCANCFDCPSCMHTLSTRATSVQVASAEDPNKTVPKKVYYLVCGFCRWTSRDVGIPDQTAASGGWQEPDNSDSKRINAMFEHYRALAQKEKLEKERKKLSRCSYLHFSDKYGLSAAVVRKLAGMNSSALGPKDDDSKLTEEQAPSEPVDEIDPLPEEYLTQPLNLSKVCTINQRLMHPEFQPVSTALMFPRRKHLLIKRSQRCKKCDHNVSKPEYNPSSIKFKIQMAAFYHIPELRTKKIPPLKLNEECKIELTLCNPSPHKVHITLLPLEENQQIEGTTAKITVPSMQIVLPPRDDTAEFDDINDTHSYEDDPQVITFRKSNKIGFLVTVQPQEKEKDVKVAFRIKHDFVNIVMPLQGEQREPQIVWLIHSLLVNFGPVI